MIKYYKQRQCKWKGLKWLMIPGERESTMVRKAYHSGRDRSWLTHLHTLYHPHRERTGSVEKHSDRLPPSNRWRPSIQIHDPLGKISYSNHHSLNKKIIALYYSKTQVLWIRLLSAKSGNYNFVWFIDLLQFWGLFTSSHKHRARLFHLYEWANFYLHFKIFYTNYIQITTSCLS